MVAKLRILRGETVIADPKPKRRYKFKVPGMVCWWCNKKLWATTRATETVFGHERVLHKACLKLARDSEKHPWTAGDEEE